MKFSVLAVFLEKLEKTSSRIEITKILSELFSKSNKDEIDKIVYLLLGQLAPPHKNIVFNVAERMMLLTISKAYGVKSEEVVNNYKRLGDLGDLAQKFQTKEINNTPTIKEVYSQLLKVANEEGEGSVERKINGLAHLLANVDSLSARFISRIPIGKLRLGFSDKTIIDALSWMETGSKSKSKLIEKAYFVLPDVGLLAKLVKEKGAEKAVENITPIIGTPVLPMLAQRLKSPKEMIEKMGEVSVEPKFDGLRIQIHYKSGKNGFTKVFTRNMNETSWMFPELKNISENMNARVAILDSEAMGVDEKTKAMANFQTTMTRRRKHNIKLTAKNVGIKFYVFDILLKDGTSLISKSYKKRREILDKSVKEGKILRKVDYEVTKEAQKIEQIMKKNLSAGLEGIIVKRTDSKYIAGRTGWRWVKMKEKESAHAKLADTIDCVVMGYSRGKGKRAAFGVGQFLVGILDPQAGGKIKTISKIGTGITDEEFEELNKRLSNIVVKSKPNKFIVHKDLVPDFWVEPKLLVEIAADEITKSPKHSAGFALRFPRLVKFRDDKSINQSTNLKELKNLFILQKKGKN